MLDSVDAPFQPFVEGLRDFLQAAKEEKKTVVKVMVTRRVPGAHNYFKGIMECSKITLPVLPGPAWRVGG
ncbi:hypothetical protein M406DRAFT_320171 [Cryphonectria parasitica EP155]|uniref:Uncharacterized protein n=1 Tax=Cryphonectria parasitica (strain ATCC 38755 / EP155) TaxID=660469 RepID=A0A9P4YAL2_CRYP1|nr:uncharacterized protein M406DRAFT_320171 [Cryphonectria parasitica EP155]KAF3770079.1 hypothetical protein M406DRAFT_320171 [Cryphonectria parasitica EP155]